MSRDIPASIKDFNANRQQFVLPLKYKAMAESPFLFFRGACHLFYQDLLKDYPLPPSPLAWICGDLHTENFGSYKDGNGLVCFDINDFDEAVRAPLLYEISRLLVSVELAVTGLDFSGNEKSLLIQELLHRYRHTLIKNKAESLEQKTATGLIKDFIDKVSNRKESELLLKRTDNKPVNAKLLLGEKLLTLETEERKLLCASFTKWFRGNYHKDYNVSDAGYRIAGTGSIGVKRYLCLLENENNPKQKKLLDMKQTLPSCITAYSTLKQHEWPGEAERVIKVQEMMQQVTPAYLASFRYDDNWYVVKEIQPSADKVSIDKSAKNSKAVGKYIADLGMIVASAQLRSSGRHKTATAEELGDFAKEENWQQVVTDWSQQYARQVEKDYLIFCQAWKDGYFATI